MELVASLPPDIAALADPAARAAAPPLRPTDQDDAAAAAAVPFELLLGLLTAPIPGGESLPGAGRALPATAVDAACDSTAPSGALAKPVTQSFAVATGADLLARLKMAAAPDAADHAASAATQSAAADSAAPPFAELDSPAMPDPTPAKPVVDALPTAATTVAQSAPASDRAAALEAVLPQTAVSEPAAKPPRSGEARDSDKSAGRSSAVLADLRTAQLDPAVAPSPIGEITDAAARPAQRDSTLDVVTLPATTSPSAADTTPLPTTGAAVAPAHSHSAASPATAPPPTLAGQSAPIDTRADHWHEALASRVQVLVDQHVGEAHIKLNPPELGSVDIKISLVDDKTFVQLTAGSSAARDELTQSLPKLRELLSAGGLSLGGASVHGGSAGAGGHAQASRVAVPAYTPFAFAEGDEPEAVRPMRGPAGRIDLFA